VGYHSSNDGSVQESFALFSSYSAVNVRLNEIHRLLNMQSLEDYEAENRSPSPEPTYDGQGKRLNTRDYRIRERLNNERLQLTEHMLKVAPEYVVRVGPFSPYSEEPYGP
jgi:hypothetical protein